VNRNRELVDDAEEDLDFDEVNEASDKSVVEVVLEQRSLEHLVVILQLEDRGQLREDVQGDDTSLLVKQTSKG